MKEVLDGFMLPHSNSPASVELRKSSRAVPVQERLYRHGFTYSAGCQVCENGQLTVRIKAGSSPLWVN